MMQENENEKPVAKKGEPFDEVNVRYTEINDAYSLKEWLMNPEVQQWFAMGDEAEVIDAVNRWMSFCRYQCSLTAVKGDVSCGLATLYLNPYKALVHQAEFGIIVAKEYQGQGIGKLLLRNLMHLAKNTFGMEILHLAVKKNNSAVDFYKKFGFFVFGEQKKWGKEPDGSYCSRIFMEVELANLDEILARTA